MDCPQCTSAQVQQMLLPSLLDEHLSMGHKQAHENNNDGRNWYFTNTSACCCNHKRADDSKINTKEKNLIFYDITLTSVLFHLMSYLALTTACLACPANAPQPYPMVLNLHESKIVICRNAALKSRSKKCQI